MSRRNISKKRFPQTDSIYNSYLVSLLISRILKSGKKTIAKNIVYEAFEIIKQKTNEDSLEKSIIWKKIEIENIKTQLSLKSLIEDKFSIENLEISSKSLELKNLISFLRSFKNTPELFIMEKAIKKGYLIADLKLEFDSDGNIKSNYEINGLVKDVELNVLKKYNLSKLDFIFDYNRNNFLVKNLNFKFDKIGFSSEKVSIKKISR